LIDINDLSTKATNVCFEAIFINVNIHLDSIGIVLAAPSSLFLLLNLILLFGYSQLDVLEDLLVLIVRVLEAIAAIDEVFGVC